MKPKIFIAFFSFLLISCQNDQEVNSSNVFSTIQYDKVIAYNYNGEEGIEIIDEKGKLARKIKQQAKLNKKQIARFTNIVCARSTYGGAVAACFDPHFGVVFYKKNKPVAHVSICLDCNYLVSSVELPGEGGFSESGVEKIVKFEKELKFVQ